MQRRGDVIALLDPALRLRSGSTAIKSSSRLAHWPGRTARSLLLVAAVVTLGLLTIVVVEQRRTAGLRGFPPAPPRDPRRLLGSAFAAPAAAAARPEDVDALAVDAVYAWVDGSDPVWLAQAQPVFAAAGLVGEKDNKFRDWGELLFSMRSLHAHAPWIRDVYIVTSGPTQVPAWLNASHPRVRLVHHATLFDDPPTQLPTFNSYAIESVLHRIPGLSERYLYLNNDFLLARPAALSDFVTPTTYVRYLDWAIALTPQCRFVLFTGRDGGVPPSDAGAYAACRGDVLGWDSVLALHFFGELVTHWFGHVPRLHERRIMYAVEVALGEHLAVCRRNRLRDGATDVNIHVQHESWRVAAARRGDPGEPAVESRELMGLLIRGLPAYHYVVFDGGSGVHFYADLELAMGAHRQPLFFAIDDDLLRPSPAVLAYHRERLTAFFQRHWPDPAPWELADRVPPLLDPVAFVATPPPPPVAPSPWMPPA